MENFFKRFKVYIQSPLTTELAEVLVTVVGKIMNILSIATKEITQSRTSKSFLRVVLVDTTLTIYPEKIFKNLAGRNKIEPALKELENLFQGEHYLVTAQILQDTRYSA